MTFSRGEGATGNFRNEVTGIFDAGSSQPSGKDRNIGSDRNVRTPTSFWEESLAEGRFKNKAVLWDSFSKSIVEPPVMGFAPFFNQCLITTACCCFPRGRRCGALLTPASTQPNYKILSSWVGGGGRPARYFSKLEWGGMFRCSVGIRLVGI